MSDGPIHIREHMRLIAENSSAPWVLREAFRIASEQENDREALRVIGEAIDTAAQEHVEGRKS